MTNTLTNAKLSISGSVATASWESVTDENCVGWRLTARFPNGSWNEVARTSNPGARSLTTASLAAGVGGENAWHLYPLVKGSPSVSLSGVIASSEPPPPPPPPPGPISGVLWDARGEKAGPTNNPYLEWAAYLGPHWKSGNKHESINLVPNMDAAHGSHPPLTGNYMYRFEEKWCGQGSGEEGPFNEDRLEMSNQSQGQASVPAGLESSGFFHWTEGSHGWISHAIYLPALPQPEVKWSEDPIGMLGVCQFHGAGSQPPFGGVRIRQTQRGPERWDGRAYNPKLFGETAGGEWIDSETLKPATWYRFIWYINISSNSSLGEVKMWIAKGATAPFTKVIDGHGTTLTTSFMYPCMGAQRNESTAKGSTCKSVSEKGRLSPGETLAACEASVPPTEVFYHDGMTWCSSKEAAEAALA